KLVNYVFRSAKMPMAFFKISRWVLTSFNSALKSAICFSSDVYFFDAVAGKAPFRIGFIPAVPVINALPCKPTSSASTLILLQWLLYSMPASLNALLQVFPIFDLIDDITVQPQNMS